MNDELKPIHLRIAEMSLQEAVLRNPQLITTPEELEEALNKMEEEED